MSEFGPFYISTLVDGQKKYLLAHHNSPIRLVGEDDLTELPTEFTFDPQAISNPYFEIIADVDNNREKLNVSDDNISVNTWSGLVRGENWDIYSDIDTIVSTICDGSRIYIRSRDTDKWLSNLPYKDSALSVMPTPNPWDEPNKYTFVTELEYNYNTQVVQSNPQEDFGDLRFDFKLTKNTLALLAHVGHQTTPLLTLFAFKLQTSQPGYDSSYRIALMRNDLFLPNGDIILSVKNITNTNGSIITFGGKSFLVTKNDGSNFISLSKLVCKFITFVNCN